MTRTDPLGRLRQALLSVFSAPAEQRETTAREGARRGREDTEQLIVDEELEDSFAEVEAEFHASRDAMVERRLRLAWRRGCPVSAVRPSPVEGSARICFANGTSVIAETRPHGYLSTLAVAVLKGRVLLDDVRADGDGVKMRFVLPDRSRLTAWAVGLDQED